MYYCSWTKISDAIFERIKVDYFRTFSKGCVLCRDVEGDIVECIS